MMRYLLFGSILILLGCASNLKPSVVDNSAGKCLITAAPKLKNELYRASVDVYGNHISGLMFFKTMSDSSTNVVFTTETGLTFFNFSWDKSGTFKVQYVIKKLDRKVVINLLRKDLELIIIPKWYSLKAVPAGEGIQSVELKKETVFFSVTKSCGAIEKAEVRYKKKIKTKVSFFPSEKNIPDSVYLSHLNFNMTLALGKINRSHAPE